jgi:putative zinc finger protein
MENAEQYVMGRLGPAELEAFEEHLLVCGICQDAVDFEDEFVTLFKEVAQTFEVQPVAVASLENDGE